MKELGPAFEASQREGTIARERTLCESRKKKKERERKARKANTNNVIVN